MAFPSKPAHPAPRSGEKRSLIASIYGSAESIEGYHCRYGLNPAFQAALVRGPLRTGAHDAAGEIRGVELDDQLLQWLRESYHQMGMQERLGGQQRSR